jgi:polyphosphate kinase
VKFLAIAAANLDEFYMVRVASLLRRCRSGLEHVSADGLDIDRQVKAVRHAADAMLHDIGRLWSEELRPLLADRGIRFLDPTDYTADIRTYLDGHFNTAVCPVLTPLAFAPGIHFRTSRIAARMSPPSFDFRAKRASLASRSRTRSGGSWRSQPSSLTAGRRSPFSKI